MIKNDKRSKRKRSETGGLRKMCPCARANWMRCPHNWMLFATPGRGQKQVRVSLRTPDHAEALKRREAFLEQLTKGEPSGPLTFDQVAEKYVEAHGADYHVAAVRRLLGPKPIESITTEDIESVRAAWLNEKRPDFLRRRPGTKGGRAGANRMLARVRHMFNWSIKKRLVTRTPFKQHGVAMVALDSKAEAGRSRRLEGDEERRLLDGAADQLTRDLIVAAIETGCRRGELLSLEWPQVKRDDDGAPKRLVLTAEKTKTRRARTIPVTTRLREVLERRQKGPDGRLLGPGCYVFGSETGDRRKNFRGSWEAACEAAAIPKDDAGRFTLHFHDLRREFASRLLESGATLAEVQAALGHANITMTSRYLGTTDAGLQKAFERFENYANSTR